MQPSFFWVVWHYNDANLHVHLQGMQASAIHAAEDFKLKGSHQIANPSAKPNAYHAILSSSLAPSEKEPNRLSQEILTLFVGGSATTARVMTRVAYHVTADREVFLRLRKELEEAMPDPFTTPELEELERLQYLVSTKPCSRGSAHSLRAPPSPVRTPLTLSRRPPSSRKRCASPPP